MLPFLLSLLFVALLVYVYKRIPVDEPMLKQSPQDLADELKWAQGKASPSGRRALHVRPAVSNLMSMTSDASAASYFAAGCPVNGEELKGSLPDKAREIEVDWPLTEAEAAKAARGFLPEVMEDKWLVAAFHVEGALRVFFVRSWTGALIYVLEVKDGAVKRLWAPEGDALAEPMTRGLMDAYLFDRICLIPAPAELGDDKLKLLVYGMHWAGRHCDYVEPSGDSGSGRRGAAGLAGDALDAGSDFP
jgi:hypothetical protein